MQVLSLHSKNFTLIWFQTNAQSIIPKILAALDKTPTLLKKNIKLTIHCQLHTISVSILPRVTSHWNHAQFLSDCSVLVLSEVFWPPLSSARSSVQYFDSVSIEVKMNVLRR